MLILDFSPMHSYNPNAPAGGGDSSPLIRGSASDHISDHNPVRSGRTQWRKDALRASFSYRKRLKSVVSQWKNAPSGLWELEAARSNRATRTNHNHRPCRWFALPPWGMLLAEPIGSSKVLPTAPFSPATPKGVSYLLSCVGLPVNGSTYSCRLIWSSAKSS